MLTQSLGSSRILADLVGSIENTAPYWQDALLPRLHQATRAGGLLVMIGREPLGLASADSIVQEIERVRDAAFLLSARRPHREMPFMWARDRVAATGFRLLESQTFESHESGEWLRNELRWAQREADKVPDDGLRMTLTQRLEQLHGCLEANEQDHRDDGGVQPKRFRLGFDYALLARKESGGGVLKALPMAEDVGANSSSVVDVATAPSHTHSSEPRESHNEAEEEAACRPTCERLRLRSAAARRARTTATKSEL